MLADPDTADTDVTHTVSLIDPASPGRSSPPTTRDPLRDACLAAPTGYGVVINLSAVTRVSPLNLAELRDLAAQLARERGHQLVFVCTELMLRSELILGDLDIRRAGAAERGTSRAAAQRRRLSSRPSGARPPRRRIRHTVPVARPQPPRSPAAHPGHAVLQPDRARRQPGARPGDLRRGPLFLVDRSVEIGRPHPGVQQRHTVQERAAVGARRHVGAASANWCSACRRESEGFALLELDLAGGQRQFLSDQTFQDAFPADLARTGRRSSRAASSASRRRRAVHRRRHRHPRRRRPVLRGVPAQRHRPHAAQPRHRAGIGAGVTTLFAAALGWSTSRRLLRPISRVSNAAGEIASGGLDARMAPEADPDLARLASSFNEMADAVQTRIEREARFASDVSPTSCARRSPRSPPRSRCSTAGAATCPSAASRRSTSSSARFAGSTRWSWTCSSCRASTPARPSCIA